MNQNRSAKTGPCRTPARPARCVKCHGDPALMQDVIVFGSVITAAGLAVRNGLKSNETEMCDLCKGLGGAQCFVCEGSGLKKGVKLEEFQASGRRYGNPRLCNTCGGTGAIACRNCKGAGFVKGL